MKKFLVVLSTILILWTLSTRFLNSDWLYPWEIFKSDLEAENSLAGKSFDDCWENFRLNFPYHIQTIGISEKNSDDSQVLIISEPPSSLDTNEISNIFSHLSIKIHEETNPIGFDGWVKDLVVVLSGGTDRQKKNALLKLYSYVNASDYKPHFLDLSLPPSAFNKKFKNANYSVSAAEINSWFLTDKDDQWFVGADDEVHKFKDLVESDNYGIFYSKTPGFLIWIVPKGDIQGYKKETRQFTIDSDLILGAIAGNSSIAIIGRERSTGLYELPPLRVETIMQLAAADKEQISQSYERNSMFAGKLPGGKDWAPIYLSPDLINTEYGSLLNITDQMLKSWSQHGEVSYTNFLYKKPGEFPYARALSDEINTTFLTFNWNTKGAAYTVKYNNFTVAALNRTGSLPVTYIPEGIDNESVPIEKVRECENAFYNFFSNCNDPNLIRVVQYAALYQIFSAFGITAEKGGDLLTSSVIADVPFDYAKKLLNKIKNNEIEQVDFDASILKAQSGDEFIKSLLNENDYRKLKLAFKNLNPIISNVFEQYGESGIDILAYFISHPRHDNTPNFTYNPDIITKQVITELSDIYINNSKQLRAINAGIQNLGFSRAKIQEEYVASFANSYSPWIKTPSIVVSWASDSTMMTGGHNIEAKMLGIDVDKSLAEGQMRVVEENGVRKLFVAENDVNRLTTSVVRDIEVNGKLGLQSGEGKLLGGEIRERANVFPKANVAERGLKTEELQLATSLSAETEIKVNGVLLKQTRINGEEFVAMPNSPYILYPKSKASSIAEINIAMSNRKITSGEFKVLSFVEDQATTNTLANYCSSSFIDQEISSMSDLNYLFSRNPKKTFHLVGHIEDGAIYMPQQKLRLPLTEIQKSAELNNVNFTIVGCESAFEKGAGPLGFVSKINSIDAVQALGTAIESSRDLRTFTHTLARSSELKMIVYEMPLKDIGYASELTKERVMIVSGSLVGLGTATALVVALAPGQANNKDNSDSTKAKKMISFNLHETTN